MGNCFDRNMVNSSPSHHPTKNPPYYLDPYYLEYLNSLSNFYNQNCNHSPFPFPNSIYPMRPPHRPSNFTPPLPLSTQHSLPRQPLYSRFHHNDKSAQTIPPIFPKHSYTHQKYNLKSPITSDSDKYCKIDIKKRGTQSNSSEDNQTYLTKYSNELGFTKLYNSDVRYRMFVRFSCDRDWEKLMKRVSKTILSLQDIYGVTFYFSKRKYTFKGIKVRTMDIVGSNKEKLANCKSELPRYMQKNIICEYNCNFNTPYYYNR